MLQFIHLTPLEIFLILFSCGVSLYTVSLVKRISEIRELLLKLAAIRNIPLDGEDLEDQIKLLEKEEYEEESRK